MQKGCIDLFIIVLRAFLTIPEVTPSIPLNFVEIAIGYPQIGASPAVLHPTFELAIQKLNSRYPVLFHNYTWTSKISLNESACTITGREMVMDFITSFYEEREKFIYGQTIILAPLLCPTTFFPVADLARELGVLIATCVNAFVDETRFPTAISFSYGDISAYAKAVVAFVRRFSWTTISVINDNLSNSEFALKSGEACRETMKQLSQSRPVVDVLEIPDDSKKTDWNPALQLRKAGDHSRVMLLCTLSDPLRKLLATADDLHMTEGDYVFLALYILQVPNQPPLEWPTTDAIDQKVRRALASLFIVQTTPVQWSRMRELTDEINTKRFSSTNRSFPAELSRNEMMVICVESMDVIAQVMNESLLNVTHHLAGHVLAKHFSNRTFSSYLTNTTVIMTDYGTRRIFPEIYQFHESTNQFQMVFSFDSVSRILTGSDVFHVLWKKQRTPPDHVACMNAEYCRFKDASRHTHILGLFMFLAAIVVIAGSTWIYVRKHQRALDSGSWWIIDRRFFVLPQDANSHDLVCGRSCIFPQFNFQI